MQGGGERIARDMNRHSAVVLQGPGMLQQGKGSNSGPSTAVDDMSQPGANSWRERGRSGLEDLRQKEAEETEGLHIQDPRRYFERTASVDTFFPFPNSACICALPQFPHSILAHCVFLMRPLSCGSVRSVEALIWAKLYSLSDHLNLSLLEMDEFPILRHWSCICSECCSDK